MIWSFQAMKRPFGAAMRLQILPWYAEIAVFVVSEQLLF